MSSSNAGSRDRELENLLGQFLVANFQTDKLAELICEKFNFRGRPKEIRILIPSSPPSSSSSLQTFDRSSQAITRPPLLLTLRVEAYTPEQSLRERKKILPTEGSFKFVSVLESPPLDSLSGPTDREASVEEILEGSFSWWNTRDQYRELKLGEWKVSTSVVDAGDDEQVGEVYRILEALEAKRSGDGAAGP